MHGIKSLLMFVWLISMGPWCLGMHQNVNPEIVHWYKLLAKGKVSWQNVTLELLSMNNNKYSIQKLLYGIVSTINDKTIETVKSTHNKKTLDDVFNVLQLYSLVLDTNQNDALGQINILRNNQNFNEYKNFIQSIERSINVDEYINSILSTTLSFQGPIVIPTVRTKITEKNQTLVDNLTKAGYFSPALQYAALKASGRPFVIDITTGVPQNLPTIDEIINTRIVDNKIKLEGLYAALEATYIAWTTAELDVAYEHIGDYTVAPPGIKPELTAVFKNQVDKIYQKMNEIGTNIFSEVAGGLYSMIFGSTADGKASIETPKKIGDNLYELSDNLIKKIIKNNNYMQQLNSNAAANLLFQQCFIMQQQRPENSHVKVGFSSHGELDEYNYIFNNFYTIDALRDYAEEQIKKPDDKNPVKTKKEMHDLLLAIRESIQIALYIANKNSSFNKITYYFTSYATLYQYNPLRPSINGYLDNVVKELLRYDKQLADMCKNSDFGGTAADQRFNQTLSTISSIVGGVVITAGAIGLAYGTYQGGKALLDVVNNVITPPKPQNTKEENKFTETINKVLKQLNPSNKNTQGNNNTIHTPQTTNNNTKNNQPEKKIAQQYDFNPTDIADFNDPFAPDTYIQPDETDYTLASIGLEVAPYVAGGKAVISAGKKLATATNNAFNRTANAAKAAPSKPTIPPINTTSTSSTINNLKPAPKSTVSTQPVHKTQASTEWSLNKTSGVNPFANPNSKQAILPSEKNGFGVYTFVPKTVSTVPAKNSSLPIVQIGLTTTAVGGSVVADEEKTQNDAYSLFRKYA